MKMQVTRTLLMKIASAGAMVLAPVVAFAQEAPPQPGQQPGFQPPPAAQQAAPAEQVAVVVNGDPITLAEVHANLQPQLQGQAEGGQIDPQTAQQLQRQTVDNLVQSRLVEQYVLKDGPDVAEEEVKGAIDRLREHLQTQNVTLDQFIASRGFGDQETLAKRIEGSLAWQKYQQEKMNPEALQQFYQQNQESFAPAASFEEAQPQVAQAYAAQLWSEIVEEMRPKAAIQTPRQADGRGAPPPANAPLPGQPR
jgi:uncharacterized protein YheU (UPF0270 family)